MMASASCDRPRPPGILAKTYVTLFRGQLGHIGAKSVRHRDSTSHKDRRATLGCFTFRRTGCRWPREPKLVLLCPVKAVHQSDRMQILPHPFTSFGL